MGSEADQRALTSCLSKLDASSVDKLSSKYWEEHQSQDEESWRAAADHVVKLIFKPNTSHAGWTSPYFSIFGKLIATIDGLCMDRNGREWRFASFITQACRREIHALLAAGVPEGVDAHQMSSTIKTGLMQGIQTLGSLYLHGCCSMADLAQVYKVILGMDGASFAEAERTTPTDQGDAVVHLMSGAPLASRPIAGEIVADLIGRIAEELEVTANRIALLASGCQVGVHLCVDEFANTPLTVVIWSPALSYDHRIEIVCASILAAGPGLRTTEEGQTVLSQMTAYLEPIKSSHTKRTQFLIEDFLKALESNSP